MAFARLTSSRGVMSDHEENGSTHQFGCSSEDMEIHILDFGSTQMD